MNGPNEWWPIYRMRKREEDEEEDEDEKRKKMNEGKKDNETNQQYRSEWQVDDGSYHHCHGEHHVHLREGCGSLAARGAPDDVERRRDVDQRAQAADDASSQSEESHISDEERK
jgi:hypothetical protein